MKARIFLLTVLLFAAASAQAGNLLMVRVGQGFPETMLELQGAIKDQGYTLSRVQRVDIGLTSSGYQTDKYRIVFFGKPEQIRELSDRHPQLIPYLPLKMTIFAEGTDTLVTTMDPEFYAAVVDAPELRPLAEQWERDVLAILDRLRAFE